VILNVLVAKDSSSPVILKLVLHGLVSLWKPDLEFLAQDHGPSAGTVSATKPRPSVEQLADAVQS